MDQSVVQRIVEDWRLTGPPIRPSAQRLEVYRSALASAGAGSAMVLGATPELIDMLLAAGVPRVAAVDLHPETIEAMRCLGREDWSCVEVAVGDWRDRRQGWECAFDLVLCDGGFNFLAFPDDWRHVLGVVHAYLRPRGRLVVASFGVSATDGGFRAHYARAVALFESERPSLDAEQQARRFVELAAMLKTATLFGAVDADGRVRLDLAAAAAGWIGADLRRRYPARAFERTIQALFGRPNPVGVDGARLVAVPPLERIEAELVGCGFGVEVLTSFRRPPLHSFMLAAIRPR